jgi:hypothetical protein
MAQRALPKDVPWDMQAAGILTFDTIIAGRLDNGDQVVERTTEMAVWCRQEAQRKGVRTALGYWRSLTRSSVI